LVLKLNQLISMQKIRFIGSVIGSIMLLSSLVALNLQQADAQTPQPQSKLVGAKCVSSGQGSARKNQEDISIGKAVYTSEFYLGPGNRSASMTCKIKPDNRPEPIFQTLNIGFGMRDNDISSPAIMVRIYLDGREVESTVVAPGQQTILPLNVSNASNVALEAICTTPNRYCERVYFFTASLERKPQPKPEKK